MDMLIGLMVMAGMPAYFVAQPVALLNWRGGWRKAAAAPLMLSVPALLFSLFALTQGSTLWPLTLIIAAALGMTYLVMLWLVRWWLY